MELNDEVKLIASMVATMSTVPDPDMSVRELVELAYQILDEVLIVRENRMKGAPVIRDMTNFNPVRPGWITSKTKQKKYPD